ncbi:MAG TPA: hypothetical protein ENN43_01320 [bacterium]|nr:hypothetical protein [bacterium]
MRIKAILAAAAVLIATGCGSLKNYPASALEMAEGGPDYAIYGFEDGTRHDFQLSTAGDGNSAFTGFVNTQERAYKGSRSLRVQCDFNGVDTGMGGLIKKAYSSPFQDLTGKKITAYIWMPKGSFTEENPYGGSFYFKTGEAYQWYQSEWQNLNVPDGPGAGLWTKIEAYSSEFALPPPPYGTGDPITADALQDVREFGVKVGQGDGAKNFQGFIYIDSIDIK